MLQLLALPISPHGSSSLMKKQIGEICTRRVDELQSNVGIGVLLWIECPDAVACGETVSQPPKRAAILPSGRFRKYENNVKGLALDSWHFLEGSLLESELSSSQRDKGSGIVDHC